MRIKTLCLAASSAAALLVATHADAAVTVSFTQVGSDVVATATGTFDTSLSPVIGSGTLGKYILPNYSFFGIGSGTTVNFYGAVGPAQFGMSGPTVNDSTTSGLGIGINTQAQDFFVDTAYVSNSAILSTATFANTTIAAIGLTPGSYLYTVGGNSVTINIGQAVAGVPEPASWAMMIAGFGAIGFAMRRRARMSARVHLA